MTEVNPEIDEDPGLVNSDPYGAGWLFKISPVRGRRRAAARPAVGRRLPGADSRRGVSRMARVTAEDLQRYDTATAHLEPPFAVVDLAALRANAADMTRRAAGKPIRLASKSVRCRELIDARAGAWTASAGSWPSPCPRRCGWPSAGTSDDIVVAYPTADRAALARLAGDAAAARAITVMVDCTEHLDLIAEAAASRARARSRSGSAIDIDAGYLALRRAAARGRAALAGPHARPDAAALATGDRGPARAAAGRADGLRGARSPASATTRPGSRCIRQGHPGHAAPVGGRAGPAPGRDRRGRAGRRAARVRQRRRHRLDRRRRPPSRR